MTPSHSLTLPPANPLDRAALLTRITDLETTIKRQKEANDMVAAERSAVHEEETIRLQEEIKKKNSKLKHLEIEKQELLEECKGVTDRLARSEKDLTTLLLEVTMFTNQIKEFSQLSDLLKGGLIDGLFPLLSIQSHPTDMPSNTFF